MRKRLLVFMTIAMLVLGLTSLAAADYPEKPIKLVVPYNPGGGSDTTARIITKHLKKYMDQPVVVVNMNGAGGTLGCREVKNAESTGYTLLLHHAAMHTAKYSGLVEWGSEAFTPVAALAAGNEAYVVRADSSWDSMEEFIADAKKNPGKIKFGMETGGTSHFKGLALENKAGIDLNLVDMGGGSQRIATLKGGFVDMIPVQVGTAKEFILSGDFKALGVMAEERDELAPEIPTLIELGIDLDFPMIYGIYGPKGLPAKAVNKLNQAFVKLVKDREFKEDLSKVQKQVYYRSQDEYEKLLREKDSFVKELAELVGF